MGKSKIAITLDREIVKRIDYLVTQKAYLSRSQAIEEAVKEKLNKLDKSRLTVELSKLDPNYERDLAEESIEQDASEWPEY